MGSEFSVVSVTHIGESLTSHVLILTSISAKILTRPLLLLTLVTEDECILPVRHRKVPYKVRQHPLALHSQAVRPLRGAFLLGPTYCHTLFIFSIKTMSLSKVTHAIDQVSGQAQQHYFFNPFQDTDWLSDYT